ncbi:MAG: hypothetical protein P4L44_03585 [Oryzomonas sp.]|uniref:hypothetical protein n=1 Tax=Oryzomonas sp. TaxID=2855186 RepID=UPI00284AFD52|nr:hypothetical protein [Oryzomonas sp.]MDR3579029.1 hypothetical protein [Oryzomonas sp.]
MAFSLDHSLTHIEIKEPDLAELYRSSNSAVPPEAQCQGHPCEAYVCSAREDDRFCVYVAFFDISTQCPVILSTTGDVRKPADQKRLVNEALKLTKSMGFDMEPLKLDYSAAMRQVIIQGINVMRPPSPSKTVAHPAEEPDNAPLHDFAAAGSVSLSLPEVTPPEVAALSAEVADLRRALTDMESAKDETERMAEQTILGIKLELERTIALYRERERAFQQEPGDRRQEQAPEGEADLLAELGSKTEALRALEEMLVRETANQRETETRANELGHRLERAEEASAALRRELDRLHQDVAAERLRAEEQLAGEVARRDAEGHAATEREQLLRDELAAARHENSVMQDTLKNVLKEQQVFVNEREALRAELAVLRESAGIERQQEMDPRVQEQEGLQSSIKRLEYEQMEARQRYETLLAEKELELKTASIELKSLSARQEHLLGEKKLWDTIAGSFKKKAHKAVERLTREKQALEEKLMQMEEAGPRPVSLFGQTGAEPSAVASPFAALGLTDTGPGFAGFGSLGPATVGDSTIRYAPQVSVISYHSTDDIVEVYGSANVIRATPEGRRSQDCSAYVCVVEQGGKTAIHLAWHLLDSGEVLICLPEKQPDGAGNYARALQDAIFYFESVGFMMDRFELSRNSYRQLKALEKIGICKMDAPAAGEQEKRNDPEDAGALPAAA